MIEVQCVKCGREFTTSYLGKSKILCGKCRGIRGIENKKPKFIWLRGIQ